MRIWTIPAAALALLNLCLPARSEQIGATIKIVNQVTAQFNRDTRTLIEGDGVNQDELIAVGSDGLGELVFKDKTKLALGPGSQMKLDKFVYDPDKPDSSIAVDLIKGTFRFITGVAEKPAYVIRTPSASITVRGTVFDVFILKDGATWLLLHEGAVAVRNERGKCNLLDTPGRLIRVTGSGDVGIPVNWRDMPGNRDVAFEDAFPFVAKPPSMDPNPAFTQQAILNAPAIKSQRSLSCDEPRDNPKKPVQQRADDGDGPSKEKSGRKARNDDDKPARVIVENPIKVVVPVKPKKPKPSHGGNYGDKDENVKVMDGMGIALSVGGGFIKGSKGGSKMSQKGGDYGGSKMPKMSKPMNSEIPR